MKNIKLKIVLTLFLLLIIFTKTVKASYETVTMSVVEEPICTINFGTSSFFEKKLYSKDLTKKEVTLQLKVVNNEVNLKPTGELMLVIDNSKSMLDKLTDGTNREDLVIESAKTLITNLLEDNSQLKIGAVSFSSNSDISKEGTIEDARLVSNLTSDKTELMNSISNIEYDGPRTDLDAGITLASKYFTNATDAEHKYIVVLSDGVPNVAVDYDKNYYSDDVISKTKNKLLSLGNIMNTNNIFIMLTGISNGSAIAAPSVKTYDDIIKEIFGTPSKPTVGKFYYVTDNKIEQTITTDIYKDLLPVSQSFTDIKILDYFPEEIVKNFEFAYVEEANIGNISVEIDKSTNSILWTIPELKSGETAIVQYKLKLIKDFDSNIINKILDTNTKVDLTYTDSSNTTDTKTSDITPKLKLIEPEPKPEPKPEPPTEELPKVFPKTGSTTLFGIITFVLVIVCMLGIRYNKFKNIK